MILYLPKEIWVSQTVLMSSNKEVNLERFLYIFWKIAIFTLK